MSHSVTLTVFAESDLVLDAFHSDMLNDRNAISCGVCLPYAVAAAALPSTQNRRQLRQCLRADLWLQSEIGCARQLRRRSSESKFFWDAENRLSRGLAAVVLAILHVEHSL